MKLITYAYENRTSIGAVLEGTAVVDLATIAPDMRSLIARGADGLARARALLQNERAALPLEAVTLLAPLAPVRNVMCLGKNYAAHAAETQRTWGEQVELPQFPIVFTKATTAVTGPYADIPFDATVSKMIDYEAELAVVIGRAGKNITPQTVMEYVFGYTVLNDVTARDLQRQHKQFFKGKSLDGHCPMGPWIVTAAEIADPHALAVTCRVNDVLKQDGRTSQMIFDIPTTIAQLSRGMTLLPGDVIATGTPSGVGFARTPPEFLEPGDVVECSVEGIGTIRNCVTAVD